MAGGEYVEKAKIGRAIMDADVFISLSHFKGHEQTGFGGALKNIGMGCGSRRGKMEQHSGGKPVVKPEALRRLPPSASSSAGRTLSPTMGVRHLLTRKSAWAAGGASRCVTLMPFLTPTTVPVSS